MITSLTASFAKEELDQMPNPPYFDVALMILAGLEIPEWEKFALLGKSFLGLDNAEIIAEWSDLSLDEIFPEIVDRAARLGFPREVLSPLLSPMQQSLRDSLAEVLKRSPMAMRRWQDLLPSHGHAPIGTLTLGTFFADPDDAGADLSHWADTARDAVVTALVRYELFLFMFKGAIPIPFAIVGWIHHRLQRDPAALYAAYGHLPLRVLWERHREVILADLKLPAILVEPILDWVAQRLDRPLREIVPPDIWRDHHEDLTDLLAGQIDPKRVLPDFERRARFVGIRNESRDEAEQLYDLLADRLVGDTCLANYLLIASRADPALQVECQSFVVRSRARKLLD